LLDVEGVEIELSPFVNDSLQLINVMLGPLLLR
jgi:hypothetical protein